MDSTKYRDLLTEQTIKIHKVKIQEKCDKIEEEETVEESRVGAAVKAAKAAGKAIRGKAKVVGQAASQHPAAAGAVAGVPAGLAARVAILRKKCRTKFANDPDKLKQCLAAANKTKTASGKYSGFK